MEPQPKASPLFHESHILSGTAEIGAVYSQFQVHHISPKAGLHFAGSIHLNFKPHNTFIFLHADKSAVVSFD